MIQWYIMYLRKSRSDGENETIEQVLAKHETQLQEYATNVLGKPLPEKNIYREVVSGETISNRPEIQKVLSRIEQGDIKGVLVIEPQRLSRGDLVDCGTIINAFRYTNTTIITPSMTYDLSKKMDRKFMEQELMRGNDYLEYTKEILNRGRIASVKKGNFIGSIPPYGYKKVRYKDEYGNWAYTLEIVPEEAAGIRAMFDAFVNKGYGYANTAYYMDSLGFKPRKAEHWSAAAIKDMLANPVYIGKIRWNWRKTQKVMVNGTITASRPKSNNDECILVDGRHNAIVSEAIYNKAATRYGRIVRSASKRPVRNCFSGLLYCSCGRAMIFRPQPKCEDRLMCGDQVHCKTKSCTYAAMKEHVIHILEQAIRDFKVEMKKAKKTDYNAELLRGLNEQLKKIDQIDEEQHDLLESCIYTRDVFLERNTKLMKRREDVLNAIENVKNEQASVIDYKERIQRFQDAIDALNDPTCEPVQQNIMLKRCFLRLTYSSNAKQNKWDSSPFSLDSDLNI